MDHWDFLRRIDQGPKPGDISVRVLVFIFLFTNVACCGLTGLLFYGLKHSVWSGIVLGIMFSVYFDFVMVRCLSIHRPAGFEGHGYEEKEPEFKRK